MDWTIDREDAEHPITGNIVRFPRERRDDISNETAIYRARIAARCAGCNAIEVDRIAIAAKEWLAHGMLGHECITKAASLARALCRADDSGVA